MDNLTHSLTGLLMSRAGLNRWCPRATALLLIAANAPDIDVVSWFGGPIAYLEYHRGITHSIVMGPLMAALPVALVALLTRKRLPWIRAWIVSLFGVASHLLFDWTNVYGVRLLLPFSSQWLRLDTVFIVDVWIWALFIFALGGPLISRLVSSEIGAKPGTGRGVAVFALSMLVCYEYARYILHARAIATLDARLYENAAPLRVYAFPHVANPLRWTGVVEGHGLLSVHDMNLLLEFDPGAGQIFYKPAIEGPLEAARRTEAFEQFLKFSQLPLWRALPADEPQGATRVEVVDLRFGAPPDAGFCVSALVDRNGSIVQTSIQLGAAAREVE